MYIIINHISVFPSKLSMEIKGSLGKHGLRRQNNVH